MRTCARRTPNVSQRPCAQVSRSYLTPPAAARAAREPYRRAVVTDLGEVLGQAPIPGLGPGLGALPRFRSEIGPFLGLAGAIDGRWLDGGFTPSNGHGFIAGVDLAARVGLGLDG